jgi:hypothetical protein
MKRILLIVLVIIVVTIIMVAIALYVPNSLPAHSDFSALYNTDLALVHRIPIYDLPEVEALAQQSSGVSPEKFFLARFPYPPWYALSTFYLGLMPAKAAATLWFELNLVMLLLSIWLLTDGWPGHWRLISFPLALLFLPVLGALSVGQYDFPVLLGTSLLIYSLRKENVTLTVLGILFLTFKPHVGALILLSVLVWLMVNKRKFLQRVLRPLLIAVAMLLVTGFIADPAWIVSYPRMLLNYQSEGNVSTCSECASLPVWLAREFFDGSLTSATWIALAVLVLLVVSQYVIRHFLNSHELLLSAALLVTLLASPYLYNYDFLLLLVPFAVLISRSTLVEKIILLVCYLAPTFALLLYGRNGNISLILVSVLILLILYKHSKHPIIDFPAHAA